MANATSLTLTELTANGSIAAATSDDFDTGASATVETTATSEMDRIFIIAEETGGVNALTVTIELGEYPPAWRKDLGDLEVTVGTSATKLIGPFEAARFAQADGKLQVTVAQTALACSLTTYVLPVA